MVPLTRPVDTLVITLRTKDSGFAKVLFEVSESMPNIVEWRQLDRASHV